MSSDALTAFEKSLTSHQLAQHIEQEALAYWQGRKGVTPWSADQALTLYTRDPQGKQLYEHHARLVQRERKADVEKAAEAWERQQTVPVSKADEAYDDLARMAKAYVRDHRAPDFETALTMVIKDQDHLYQSYTTAMNATRIQKVVR